MATISAWLVSEGASLLLGAVANILLQAWRDYQAGKTTSDLATSKANLDVANRTIAAQQAELQAQADAPRDADDAIKRLEEGSA